MRAASRGISQQAIASTGVAVGEGVGDGGDAFGPLGEQEHVAGGHAGEPAGDAAVLVEDPHVEVRDRLAGGLDQVLHQLGHPGADRAVRDREQPVYSVTCLGSGSPGLTSGASRGWPSGTIPVWSSISRSYQNAAPSAGGARVSDG